jgi:hypothetical protein
VERTRGSWKLTRRRKRRLDSGRPWSRSVRGSLGDRKDTARRLKSLSDRSERRIERLLL